MMRIVVERDGILNLVPVVLDPETPEDHRRAIAEFYSLDDPDFAGWCRRVHTQIPGLYPAKIVFAGAQLEAFRRNEREMQALLGANRAVARGYHGEIRGAFEAHQAAMAAAGEGLAVGHRFAPCVTVVSRRAISGELAAASLRGSDEAALSLASPLVSLRRAD